MTPEAAVNAMCWQPIDTAPRDGTRILVTEPASQGYCLPFVAFWVEGFGWEHQFAFDGPNMMRVCPPTHWMPLPEPPLA